MNNPIQDTECLHSIPLYYKLSRFSGEICLLQAFSAVLTFDSTLGAPLGVPQNRVSHLEGSFQENWGQLSSLARIFQMLNSIPSLTRVEKELKSLNFHNILNVTWAPSIPWLSFSMHKMENPPEALLPCPHLYLGQHLSLHRARLHRGDV